MADTPTVAEQVVPDDQLPPEAVERRNAQKIEYGTWVATSQIWAGNALAYDVGHPVPVSNVERHGYDKMGLVAKRDSKAGKAILAALGQEV